MTVALFATIFNIKRHSPTMNFNTKSALFNEDDVPCCAWAFFALQREEVVEERPFRAV